MIPSFSFQICFDFESLRWEFKILFFSKFSSTYLLLLVKYDSGQKSGTIILANNEAWYVQLLWTELNETWRKFIIQLLHFHPPNEKNHWENTAKVCIHVRDMDYLFGLERNAVALHANRSISSLYFLKFFSLFFVNWSIVPLIIINFT